jgi:hypothetical protein
MTLADAFVPELQAGKYKLTAKQSLVFETSGGGPKTWETSATKTFWVRAPRFRLAPDEIYSVYPPDGQSGAYHGTLPHVVFRRKALPWERALDDERPQERNRPWMALLLFDELEFAEVHVSPRPLQDVAAPSPGVRGPRVNLDMWEMDNRSADERGGSEQNICTTIDVPYRLFRQIAPHLADLDYLAHARSVATGDKEDLPGIGDGSFSVILANRLPAEGQRNIVVLISLEGVRDLIEDAAPTPLPEAVRLVVLTQWSFRSEGPTFEDVLNSLCDGKDMWLRSMPTDAAQHDTVRTALELGYVPLAHALRQGDSTISWYRGPLVPVPIPAETESYIFANPDEALQYDEATGVFDTSYAAAWQLGRLLALQAPEFARALAYADGSNVGDAAVAKAEEEFSALFHGAHLDRGEAMHLLRDDLIAAMLLETFDNTSTVAG